MSTLTISTKVAEHDTMTQAREQGVADTTKPPVEQSLAENAFGLPGIDSGREPKLRSPSAEDGQRTPCRGE